MIQIIIYSVLIIVLIFLSAFFSSADMAIGCVSEVRLKKIENENKKAKIALRLVEDYDSTISVILFLNDLVNVASETLSAVLGYIVFEKLNLDTSLGSAIGSVVILFLVIIFGEILPKSLSKNNVFDLSLKYSPIINVLKMIFKPLVFVTSNVGRIFKEENLESEHVDEELEEMVDDILNEGEIDKNDADILKGTIDYASTEAYEVMTPRVDVKAINIKTNYEELFSDKELFTYSRIPVYKDTIDNIIGYVLTKDIVRMYLRKEKLNLRSILKKVNKFPRSTEINDILLNFKNNKSNFGVILDEYGGVEGIITIEDILEEIVGEIHDEEDDDKDDPIKKINEESFIIDGTMNLEDFFDTFNIDKDNIETEYVTIGGYIIELKDDKFASKGDVIYFKNLKIEVLAVDENMTIEKIKVDIIKN